MENKYNKEIKEQFVTYKIAKELKELGFDDEVLATYDTEEVLTENELKIFAFSVPNKGIFEEGFKKNWCIRAPLWQQTLNWLIIKYNIFIQPKREIFNLIEHTWSFDIYDITMGKLHIPTGYHNFPNYPKMIESAILKVIEILKKTNQPPLNMETNLDNITAENMIKLSTKDKDIEELKNILTQIKTQAENGNTNIYIPHNVKNTTKLELEKRGFKIITGGRYNEIDTVISWD